MTKIFKMYLHKFKPRNIQFKTKALINKPKIFILIKSKKIESNDQKQIKFSIHQQSNLIIIIQNQEKGIIKPLQKFINNQFYNKINKKMEIEAQLRKNLIKK